MIEHPNIVMFPQEYLELAREALIHVIPGVDVKKDLVENLPHIAAYCGVILDGDYTPEDVIEICRRLTAILRKSNIIQIN